MALEQELETYRARLPELLAHEGEFVVIHGNQIGGILPTWSDALEAGYRWYGPGGFFIREISAVERVEHI